MLCLLFHQIAKRFKFYSPCRGKHNVFGHILLGHIVLHNLLCHIGHALRRTQNRPCQRMIVKIRFGQQVVHQILRRILHHVDLFEHHAFFLLHFPFIQRSMKHHITQQIQRLRQLFIRHPRMITCAFFRCKRIQNAAHAVHLCGNLLRRAALCAFEKHMLYKMRNAALLRQHFVGRAGADPYAHAHRAKSFYLLGHYANPVF